MSRVHNAGPAKRTKRPPAIPLDGMLLLDKPDGLSSNQALQQAKRLLGARKAGHTGSLDPIATGLLPLCFGAATRIAGLFLDANKTYRVQIKFGIATDTGDRQGQVRAERTVNFTAQQLNDALDQFRGSFTQIPPMYSALKHNGQRLYKLAREGITVERAPRAVTVYALSIEKWCDEYLELCVSCSRGFYVRTLAEDIGEILGCGAHVQELRRTAVGNLQLENAVTLAQLEATDDAAERRKLVLPTEQGLAHLSKINLPDNIAFYMCRGRTVRAPLPLKIVRQHDAGNDKGYDAENDEGDGEGHDKGNDKSAAPTKNLVRVYSDSNGFLGLAEINDDGKVTPKLLFHTT